MVKNSPAMQETWVRSLGLEDLLENGKTTHSSVLAWRILWTVQSMGSQRVGHDSVTFTLIVFTISCSPTPKLGSGWKEFLSRCDWASMNCILVLMVFRYAQGLFVCLFPHNGKLKYPQIQVCWLDTILFAYHIAEERKSGCIFGIF